jgi:hypothetical protein
MAQTFTHQIKEKNMSAKKVVVLGLIIVSFAALAAVVKFDNKETGSKDEKQTQFERVLSDESAKSVSYY